MIRPKLSIPVALVAALLLLAAPVAGQEEKCDAKPRWIAVDVVRGVMKDSVGGLWELAKGLQLLDRCRGFGVTEAGGGAGSMVQEAVADGARSVISQTTRDSRGEVAIELYYVRESVHQICAAMDDCGDAVRQTQEEGER